MTSDPVSPAIPESAGLEFKSVPIVSKPLPAGLVCQVAGVSLAIVIAGTEFPPVVRNVICVATAPVLGLLLVQAFLRMNFAAPSFVNGTPRQLALIRIIVCGCALIMTLMEDFAATASFPPQFRSNGKIYFLLNSIPGYEALLSQPLPLGMLQWGTAAFLMMGLVGFKTRISILLGGIGFFLIQAILRQYTYYFHTGMVPLYLLAVLACSPCAVAWSIDSRLNPARRAANPQSIGLAVFACISIIALMYLACGLSKFGNSGIEWFSMENIRQKLLRDTMNPIFLEYDWRATLWLIENRTPAFMFVLIGIFGVAIELGYITVLFSRWARFVFPVLAAGLHLGILIFQHILFLDLIILQLLFVNADKVTEWVNRKRSRAIAALPAFPAPNSTISRIGVSAVSIVISGSLLIWALRIEYFPVSAWQMYSETSSEEPIVYYKMVATLTDGRSLVVPRRDYCPAVMPNSRIILGRISGLKNRSKSFDAFLKSYAERRNRTLAFGLPIAEIEVQRWRWDYALNLDDPEKGSITDRYVYRVNGDSSGPHTSREEQL